MAAYSDILYAEAEAPNVLPEPLGGVSLYVLLPSGAEETLTDSNGNNINQPYITPASGVVSFNVPDPGNTYNLQYRYGGRLIRNDQVIIGTPANVQVTLDSVGEAISTTGIISYNQTTHQFGVGTSTQPLTVLPIGNGGVSLQPGTSQTTGYLQGLLNGGNQDWYMGYVPNAASPMLIGTAGRGVKHSGGPLLTDSYPTQPQSVVPLAYAQMLTKPLFSPEIYRAGGSDTAAVQAAINAAAAAGGGTVMLPQSYSITGLTAASNVTITGGSLIAAAGCSTMIDLPNNVVNFTVTGCIIDGTGLATTGYGGGVCIGQNVNLTATNVRILGNHFVNIPLSSASYHAILMNNSTGIFSGNYVDQSGGDAVNINGSYWIITNNEIQNSSDGGVALNNGAAGLVGNNRIYRCNLGVGVGPNGTTSAPYTNLMIVGNDIDSCNYGINAAAFGYAGRESPRYLTIKANHIASCKSAGISYAGPDATVTMDIFIVGNDVVEAGSTAFDGNTGSGVGYIINDAPGASVIANTAVGCVGAAYYFDSNPNLTFSENVARRCQKPAVWVSTNTTNTVNLGKFHISDNALPSDGAPQLLSGELELTTTLDSTGNGSFAHNLGTPALKFINRISAHASNGSALYPLVIVGVDGTNVNVNQGSNALAGKPAVAKLDLQYLPITGM